MQRPEVEQRLQEFEEYSRRARTPFTQQRRVILELLLMRRDHPTTDDIYVQTKKRMPSISKATVYRALETLVKAGFAQEIFHGAAEVRFDGLMERHHHFVCTSCGKTTDIQNPKLDVLPLSVVNRREFYVEDYSVYFRGKCKGCSKSRSKRNNKEKIK